MTRLAVFRDLFPRTISKRGVGRARKDSNPDSVSSVSCGYHHTEAGCKCTTHDSIRLQSAGALLQFIVSFCRCAKWICTIVFGIAM